MEKNSPKIKVYFCDLVHNYLGAGTYIFPLNIGYIAAYAQKIFPEKIDFKLFKYPDKFMEQFKKDTPDVVAFGNYTWNVDINKKISKWVKSLSSKTIVVFGGPNLNYSPEGYKKFFSSHEAVDFCIPYQGETPFVNLLKEIFNNNLNLSSLKSKPIDGILYYDKKNNTIVQGNLVPKIKDLDIIPSPYLTGLLDEFFETNLIPIVETNRGCPYRCTYCCQGVSSHNTMEFYSLERVKEELSYIAHKVKNTNILLTADSNFGIVKRDIDIAKHIAKLTEETGYPRKVIVAWAKNQPKIFEIAKILKNINLDMSLQSLDEIVLKSVKRQNIDLKVFRDTVDKINKEGGIPGTEIILALPGETKQSHLNTLRQLFDWDVALIVCYMCLLLEGSEMSLTKEKGELKCQTKFRLMDNAFGKYDGITSFEVEEGIRSLPTMSEEDILYFRPVHWLIQYLWNYRFYYDFLKFLKSLEINPLDYIIKLIDNINDDTPEKFKKIFKEFEDDAKKEWFDSPEALEQYYSQPEKFDWLAKGNYGKLNSKYIFKTLLEGREDFEKYLYDTAVNYSPVCHAKKEIIEDLLIFISASIIDFSKDWEEISQGKIILSKYNILEWQKSGYQKNLEEFYYPSGIKFKFYLPKDQEQALKTSLKQYEHKNKNVTLRKMSEFMDFRDFLYRAEIIN
jgi:radical SAM superfamily enzyme YgiQ (UPF0313 family)